MATASTGSASYACAQLQVQNDNLVPKALAQGVIVVFLHVACCKPIPDTTDKSAA
jgi:hypothetical protein